jgi:hypothetical protein
MRKWPSLAGLSLLGLVLPNNIQAVARYNRPINIITSNYDLVDTTYIDRGRLDGVKVGDKFQVKFRDGKLVTQVVVTGVFERMAAVKIEDSWLLKDGQVGSFEQRPMVVALERKSRRPAPDITIKARREASTPAPGPAAASLAPATPATAPEMPPNAPGAEPGPVVSGVNSSLPGVPDVGLPATPDAGMPPLPGADMGLPPAPDAGMPPAPGADMGLPPAPNAGMPPAPGADMGLPPAPDAGMPPLPGADMDLPPPPF